MKLSAGKALVTFVFILSIALINCPSHAIDVSGVIDTDTIWSPGEPYIVTGGILVNPGVTLTIEAGVQVRFNGGYNISVQGNIRALGTQYNEILLTSNLTTPQLGDWDGIKLFDNIGSELNGVIIEYAGTAIHLDGGSNNKINNSIFRNCYHSIYSRSSGTLSVSNTYFYNIHGNAVAISGEQSVVLLNDTMENVETGVRIYRSSDVTINNVNILNVTGNSVNVTYPAQGIVFDGRYNYWGAETTDEMNLKGATANIEKIYDFYDDHLLGRVDYAEWLNAPNPNAYPWMGGPPVNQSPVAIAGSDQAVFDTVTLDGSASYDPDGEIASYEWVLEYVDDVAHDRTAIGVNPTITDLYSGFYNVSLTVTDNEGATNTNTSSIVAASGPCVCTASIMYVESIVAGTVRGSKGQSFGEVIVTVSDDYGKPVAGATVTGTFTIAFDETSSGVTDGNGVAVIRTAEEFKKPLYEFCVDNVVKDGLEYISDDNLETCRGN